MAAILFAYGTYFFLFSCLIFYSWGCNLQSTIMNGLECNVVTKGKGSVFKLK